MPTSNNVSTRRKRWVPGFGSPSPPPTPPGPSSARSKKRLRLGSGDSYPSIATSGPCGTNAVASRVHDRVADLHHDKPTNMDKQDDTMINQIHMLHAVEQIPSNHSPNTIEILSSSSTSPVDNGFAMDIDPYDSLNDLRSPSALTVDSDLQHYPYDIFPDASGLGATVAAYRMLEKLEQQLDCSMINRLSTWLKAWISNADAHSHRGASVAHDARHLKFWHSVISIYGVVLSSPCHKSPGTLSMADLDVLVDYVGTAFALRRQMAERSPPILLGTLQSIEDHVQALQGCKTVASHYVKAAVTSLATGSANSHIFMIESQDTYVQSANIRIVSILHAILSYDLPETDLAADPQTWQEVISQLIEILKVAWTQQSQYYAKHTAITYSLLIHIATTGHDLWNEFAHDLWHRFSQARWALLYRRLLCLNPIEDQRHLLSNCIINVCRSDKTTLGVPHIVVAEHHWRHLSLLVCQAVSQRTGTTPFFSVVRQVFEVCVLQGSTVADLQACYSTWSRELFEYPCGSAIPDHEDKEESLRGLAYLLTSYMRLAPKLPASSSRDELSSYLFERLLPCPKLQNVQLRLGSLSTTIVLNRSTRQALFHLLYEVVANEDVLEATINKLQNLATCELTVENLKIAPQHTATSRSPVQYSGLPNLGNTCYMNSLISLLFMNVPFRRFMIGVGESAAHPSQTLLRETRNLFNCMQNGHGQYLGMKSFVAAFGEARGTPVNTALQMDVGEFQAMLFDQWESQMADGEMKTTFKRFFGGKVITQTVSMDCQHVSERQEYFLTISCTVKGMTGLGQSLRGFVEGERLTGENKYRCAECGNRLVDAVMRTGFKTLPDSIIIHLKRFGWDVTGDVGRKINDEFAFPRIIDMSRFYAKDTSAGEERSEDDWFVLTGILVHQGGTESGHYYSFAGTCDGWGNLQDDWMKLDDDEVSAFDNSAIPDECFGGRMPDGSFTNKSAYMLFYQRSEHNPRKLGLDAPAVSKEDNLEADSNLRKHYQLNFDCLTDPGYTELLIGVLARVKTIIGHTSSVDLIADGGLIWTILDHVAEVTGIMADQTSSQRLLDAVSQAINWCPNTIYVTSNWIMTRLPQPDDSVPQETKSWSTHLQILCDVGTVRAMWAEFIFFNVLALQQLGLTVEQPGLYPELMTIEGPEDRPDGGVLQQLLNALVAFGPLSGKVSINCEHLLILLADTVSMMYREALHILISGHFSTVLLTFLSRTLACFARRTEREVLDAIYISIAIKHDRLMR